MRSPGSRDEGDVRDDLRTRVRQADGSIRGIPRRACQSGRSMNWRLRLARREQLRTAVGRAVEGPRTKDTGVCIVIDADRTLAPQDTGRLVGRAAGVDEAIRRVFETHGYVEEAFSRVAELWATLSRERYLAE